MKSWWEKNSASLNMSIVAQCRFIWRSVHMNCIRKHMFISVKLCEFYGNKQGLKIAMQDCKTCTIRSSSYQFDATVHIMLTPRLYICPLSLPPLWSDTCKLNFYKNTGDQYLKNLIMNILKPIILMSKFDFFFNEQWWMYFVFLFSQNVLIFHIWMDSVSVLKSNVTALSWLFLEKKVKQKKILDESEEIPNITFYFQILVQYVLCGWWQCSRTSSWFPGKLRVQ